MKKSRYSDSQIINILNQAEASTPVAELGRENGMSDATFYKWRAKFGGMDVSMMARLKELEEENRRLKKMYAEERLKAENPEFADAIGEFLNRFERYGNVIHTSGNGGLLLIKVRNFIRMTQRDNRLYPNL